MGLRPDTNYRGLIVSAAWIQSQKGTPGLQVNLETEDGMNAISHTFWVTDRSREFFEKAMLDFGVTREQLSSGAFMQNQLPGFLADTEVSFGTKEETYNDQTRIKVAWIGRHKGPSDERGIGYAVASMFGGEKASETEKPDTTGENLEDDDIPF